MGWTYDPTQLTVPLNQVRFLIGDTIQDSPLVEQDTEIAFCLSQKNNNVYLAGAFALRRASARLYRELRLVSKRGSLEDDPFTQAQELIKLAVQLETEASRQGGVALFFGGVSKADRDARVDDEDRVEPSFEVDSFEPNSVPFPIESELIFRQ